MSDRDSSLCQVSSVGVFTLVHTRDGRDQLPKTVFFFRIRKDGYVQGKSRPDHTYTELFINFLQQSPASVANINVINSKLVREI